MKPDRAFDIFIREVGTKARKDEFWFWSTTKGAEAQITVPSCSEDHEHYWAPALYGQDVSDVYRYRICHHCEWMYAFKHRRYIEQMGMNPR